MKLNIANEAALWYKKELSFSEPIKHLRFFPRYGGFSNHIPGFSIGISNDVPESPLISTTVENVTFFIEVNDAWYFEDVSLQVRLNEKLDEPEFIINANE